MNTETKTMLELAKEEVKSLNEKYNDGFMTTKEYLNKMVDIAMRYFDKIDYEP